MRSVFPARTSLWQSSAAVTAGILLTNLLGAGQALLLVFIVGHGERSDAFLAAYCVYVPFALLGVSMRTSLVPLLGGVHSETQFRRRASELVSRVALLGLVAAVAMVLISPLLARLLTHGLSTDGRRTALFTLLLLAPPIYLQIHSGAISGTLNAVRRFPVSVCLYVLGGSIALTTSALLLVLLGVLGSALGLVLGGVVLLSTHVAYVRAFGIHSRIRARWLRDRAQGRLAVQLFAGAALGAAQQLGVVIALSAVSGTPGAITLYAYAYFLVGLLLNLSAIPLALVTLPDAVDAIKERGRSAIGAHLLTVAPYMLVLLAPMLSGLATFGKPLLDVAFGHALSVSATDQLYDLVLILELAMVPATLYFLGGSLVLALRQWSKAVWLSVIAVLVHLVAIYSIGTGRPLAVAGAHAAAAAVTAIVLLAVLLGRGLPGVLAALARRSAPAFVLAGAFPAARFALGWNLSLLSSIAGLAVASLAYAGLVFFVWRRAGAAFLSAMPTPRAVPTTADPEATGVP